jgi:hypothetical protein
VTTWATLLGGPHDGEVRALEFAEVYYPVKRCAFRGEPLPPLSELLPPEPHRYVARQDDDGRWWYVFAGRAT